ncbi:MAG: hypothetical protein IJX36_03385, partial [Thermoguttaceae bacterium]|nr:hypothetical protein [Thermoguttaceae bacterium]
MSSRDNKKRPVYAPTVPYFIAVASGILADAWFAPGFGGWAILAILAAAASCALFGRDWKRRRAAKKSTLTLKEAVCANDADFKNDGESFNVERADLEPRERPKAKENVESETPFDADGDAAAYWADWLAANGGAVAKLEGGKRVDGEESQDWNAALSRFLAERRRRGLSVVGAARFGDVEKDGRANGDKADEAGTCVDRLRRERGVGGETDETLMFDFEGFDEFSVWRGSAFQSGERSVDGTLDDR